MNLSRDFTRIIHFILDQILPPFMRDSRFLMVPLLKLACGDKAQYFLDFKDKAHEISDEEFTEYYRQTYGILNRDTDLNKGCIEKILSENFGENVLEVGCGNGYLSGLLSKKNNAVSAVDINVSPESVKRYPDVKFKSANAEALPFEDNAFVSVICTHTLEHVLDLKQSLSELRRVAKSRLLIVVPCQRPYKYTFDLHLHFFPYKFSVMQAFQPPENANVSLVKISGDWYYREDYAS